MTVPPFVLFVCLHGSAKSVIASQYFLLAATVIALLYWRVGALRLRLAGSVLGVLRSRRSSSFHAVRSALAAGLGTGV